MADSKIVRQKKFCISVDSQHVTGRSPKTKYPILGMAYKTFMHGIFDIFNNLVFKNYYSHIPIQLSSNTFHTLVHSELKI